MTMRKMIWQYDLKDGTLYIFILCQSIPDMYFCYCSTAMDVTSHFIRQFRTKLIHFPHEDDDP